MRRFFLRCVFVGFTKNGKKKKERKSRDTWKSSLQQYGIKICEIFDDDLQ